MERTEDTALEASDVKALVYNYLCRCGYAKTAARYVKESSFSPEESNAPEEDLLFIYGYYKENYCPPIPVKKEKSSKKRTIAAWVRGRLDPRKGA